MLHRSQTVDINWAVPQSSFPLTIQLLSLHHYCYPTLLGVVVSVGGLTESTVSLGGVAHGHMTPAVI